MQLLFIALINIELSHDVALKKYFQNEIIKYFSRKRAHTHKLIEKHLNLIVLTGHDLAFMHSFMFNVHMFRMMAIKCTVHRASASTL